MRCLEVLQNKNRRPDGPSGIIIDFKTEKKLRKRRNANSPGAGWNWLAGTAMAIWFMGLFTVVGALVGRWLDSQWPTPFSWSLALMLLGAAAGGIATWRWVRQ